MLLTLKKYGFCSDECICHSCEKVTPCNECDYIAIWQGMGDNVNCLRGGLSHCPFVVSYGKSHYFPHQREEAIEKAEEIVYVLLSANDIERECHKRNINTLNNRHETETSLINALVNELM